MAKKIKKRAAHSSKKLRPSPSRGKRAKVTADELFHHLRLTQVRLISVHSDLAIHDGEMPTQARITATANVGISKNKKNVHVNCFLDIDVQPENGGEKSSCLAIHIAYQCIYEILDDVIVATPEGVAAFSQPLSQTGMLIVWPHFRELVQSIMGRMAIPPVVLPFFTRGKTGANIGGVEIELKPHDQTAKPSSD